MYSVNINLALTFSDGTEMDEERIQRLLSIISSMISSSKNWENEKKRDAFMGAESLAVSTMINSTINPELAQGEVVKMVTPTIPMEVHGAYTNEYMDKVEKVPTPGGKKAFAFTLKPKEKEVVEEEDSE